ncbi:rcc01693 family protein [Halovulum marinum]|nr:rcc01693 family protein [Halovulum marinum]
MTRIAWPALMRAGMIELGLRPDEFWALTPAELMFLAGGGQSARGALSRDGLEALLARFPDKQNGGSDGGS